MKLVLFLFLGIAAHAQSCIVSAVQNTPVSCSSSPLLGVPVAIGATPPIGTTTMSAMIIVSGAITAGCATTTFQLPAALPAGLYGVDVIPTAALSPGDLLIRASASISYTDYQTVSVQRCNTQVVSVNTTSNMVYVYRIYKAS